LSAGGAKRRALGDHAAAMMAGNAAGRDSEVRTDDIDHDTGGDQAGHDDQNV